MSRLLLDTHVLLWANAAPDRLGPSSTERLLDPSVELLVSAVSVAEIAIKRSIGRLSMSLPTASLMEPLAAVELALTNEHAAALERLPLLHRDPFDRLLAAQAMSDGVTLLTADRRLLAYPVEVMDALT